MSRNRKQLFELSMMLPRTAEAMMNALAAARRGVVGVDPGVKTGVALYGMAGGEWKLMMMDTMSPVEAAVMLSSLLRGSRKIIVAVEDARLRKHYGSEEKFIYGKLRHGLRVSHGELNRYKGRLLGAGYVQAFSALIIDTLRDNDVKVVRVTPGYARTKMDAATFREAYKYTGRTNSHERDAASIAVLPILRQSKDFFEVEDVVLR